MEENRLEQHLQVHGNDRFYLVSNGIFRLVLLGNHIVNMRTSFQMTAVISVCVLGVGTLAGCSGSNRAAQVPLHTTTPASQSPDPSFEYPPQSPTDIVRLEVHQGQLSSGSQALGRAPGNISVKGACLSDAPDTIHFTIDVGSGKVVLDGKLECGTGQYETFLQADKGDSVSVNLTGIETTVSDAFIVLQPLEG